MVYESSTTPSTSALAGHATAVEGCSMPMARLPCATTAAHPVDIHKGDFPRRGHRRPNCTRKIHQNSYKVPAACTASAFPSSTRPASALRSATARNIYIEFAYGDAVAPLSKLATPTAGAAPGDLPRLHRNTAINMISPRWSIGCASRVPEFRRQHRARIRHAVEKREEMMCKGGVEEFVKYLDRNRSDGPRPDRLRRSERHRRQLRCGGMTAIMRTCCASPTTFRSATAVPSSAPAALTLRSTAMPTSSPEGKDRADRRRLPRGTTACCR